jgi:tetratricopeptide (TPR) repeat protein
MEGEKNIREAYASLLHHDFEQAIRWFERAVQEQPDNADYHHKLSISYARSGKLAKALKHAARACELDANAQEYRYHYGHLQALDLIRKAEKLMEREQAPKRAAWYLEQAKALDPLSVEAHLLLAVIRLREGDYPRAAAELDEALALEPHHETARRMKEDVMRQWTHQQQYRHQER